MSRFCAAPWRGLHIRVNGDISVCCAGKQSFGNINKDNIQDALQHPRLQEIRKEIINGTLPADFCKICKNAVENKTGCEMNWHNSLNTDLNTQALNADYQFPVIFDARWSKTCNSSCIYCRPEFSSKWASLLGDTEQEIIMMEKYENISNFFRDNSKHLKTVALVGGEPLLIKQNSILLDHIPDNVTIDIITNFAVDLEKNKIFEKLISRKKVHWHISLDNIENRYEYVRQGSQWNTLVKNLKILGQIARNSPEVNNHEIQFFPTYNLLNCTRLSELKNFAKDVIGFFPCKFTNNGQNSIDIVWQNLDAPSELDVKQYGIDIAQQAIAEIDRYFKLCNFNYEKQFLKSQKIYLQKLKSDTSIDSKTSLANFLEKNEKLFDKKGQFTKLWPELADLIDK